MFEHLKIYAVGFVLQEIMKMKLEIFLFSSFFFTTGLTPSTRNMCLARVYVKL